MQGTLVPRRSTRNVIPPVLKSFFAHTFTNCTKHNIWMHLTLCTYNLNICLRSEEPLSHRCCKPEQVWRTTASMSLCLFYYLSQSIHITVGDRQLGSMDFWFMYPGVSAILFLWTTKMRDGERKTKSSQIPLMPRISVRYIYIY